MLERCEYCQARPPARHRCLRATVDSTRLEVTELAALCTRCAARALRQERPGLPEPRAVEASEEILERLAGEPMRVLWLAGSQSRWIVIARPRTRKRR